MADLILSDDQAEIISAATGAVAIRDASGRLLGHAVPAVSPEELSSVFSAEEIEEAKRRAGSDGPWRTTAEVLQRFRPDQ